MTHVAVGFSAATVADLDGLLPAGSVLLIEEPEVIAARDVMGRVRRHPCIGAVLPASVQDEEAADTVAAGVTRPPDVRGVLPALEYGVVVAAALADRWGLPGAGLTAARVLRDKSRLRAAGDRGGLPQPAWQLADGPGAVAAFRARHGGRCVLKPANRQASVGVQLLGPDDDLVAAWRETVGADEPRLRVTDRTPARYVVEEVLTGPEVSVECVVRDGRRGLSNVTAKRVQAGRRPIELGHVVPAPLPESTVCRLGAAMDTLIGVTGFRTGLLHAEWILVGGSEPHLVECAGRMPGDSIDVLINLVYGGRLLADQLAVLTGERGRDGWAAQRAAAIRFLDQTFDPTVAGDLVVAARTLPGVVQVEVSSRAGGRGPVTSSWDRPGWVVATGAGPEEAAARAEQAARVAVGGAPAAGR